MMHPASGCDRNGAIMPGVRQLAREYDRRTHAHAIVEIHNFRVVHSYAAPRNEPPDRFWIVRPMYRQLIVSQDKRCGSHWITRRIGGNDPRRPALSNIRRRRPGRTKAFTNDTGRSKPLFSAAANPDRVSDGVSIFENEIKLPLVGPHHDCPRARPARKRRNISRQNWRREHYSRECDR